MFNGSLLPSLARPLSCALAVLTLAGTIARADKPLTCVAPEQAADYVDKDVCISAHVYDVVEDKEGNSYLDICSPDTSPNQCKFIILSLSEDRREVGELMHYRDTDIHIRGHIRSYHGRIHMMLNHERQFHGGKERFKPNPVLLHGFDSEGSGMAFRDPTLRASRQRTTHNPQDVVTPSQTTTH